MTNLEKFTQELEKAYSVLFETDSRFAYIKTTTSASAMAFKMASGLVSGKACKDGPGVKIACKASGIKNTWKDIQSLLNS